MNPNARGFLDRGLVAQYAGENDTAIDFFALSLRSFDCAETRSHVAACLRHRGDFVGALAYLNEWLDVYRLNPYLLFQRALTYLQLNEWANGWRDYEIRTHGPGHPSRPARREFWNGEGGDVLVYGEQGVGDEIMFASVLDSLHKHVTGKIYFETSERLAPLFAQSFPYAHVHQKGEALPASVTREIPIGSLGRLYRNGAESFPVDFGYLKIGDYPVDLENAGKFTVGVCWRGGTPETRRAVRSITPERLIPTLAKPHARLVSLQHDATPEEIARVEKLFGVELNHRPETFKNFSALACQIMNCNLVVSVCSSVVHLAGALGIPTWCLTPYVPEWRYGFATDFIPWYPSVRLYRQGPECNWIPVIERLGHYFDFTSDLT